MLSVPCCFILPTYRTCRSIKEADEVPADDGVADIEQDACDAFLTRAEPCGGCDVLLREGVALFRGSSVGTSLPVFGRSISGGLRLFSQSCTCRFSFSRTIACQGNDKLRSPWPRLRMAQRSEALNRIGGSHTFRFIGLSFFLYHRRAGGQSQFSPLLDLDAQSDRVQTALTYAKEHLSTPLSVDALANAAFLGPRQFSRLFKEETGQSPAKAIERLRAESARLMMEAGRFSAEEIASKNGFGNRERMRRSFVRAFGQSPQAIQRTVSA